MKEPLDLISSVINMAKPGGDLFNYEERKVARHEFGSLIIDTCWANDCNWYETAVGHPSYNNGEWVIVEQYGEDLEAAKQGHVHWVKIMTAKDLPTQLEDIDTFSLGLEPFTREEKDTK